MGFSLSNFFSDPFAISTVSFSLISWIIAIAGSASTASSESTFPRFTWWGLVYQFLIIMVILVFYCFNVIELYKFTLVGMLSIAFVYTSNSTNTLIYESGSNKSAAAAGCILLSMVNLIWIFYFGGHPESPTNQFIDSFSLKTTSNMNNNTNIGYKEYQSPSIINTNAGIGTFQDNNLRQSTLTRGNSKLSNSQTPYMSSSQLNGLENFSQHDLHNQQILEEPNQFNDGLLQSMTFKHKARALYSYEANPDDINEISFEKGETLEVDDIEGKWWQARRSNGQIGICPSNYVELIE